MQLSYVKLSLATHAPKTLAVYQSARVVWGDGRKTTEDCDDGNTNNNDGWSSSCIVEAGYTCINGNITRRDECSEQCGDGKDYGGFECDDGNLIDNDGCDSQWYFEEWYQWTGGNASNPDTWSKLIINATMTMSGQNKAILNFDHVMNNTEITLNDMSVSVSSNSYISTSWSASYINDTALEISIRFGGLLKGGETLNVRIINYRAIRASTGGCVRPSVFSTTLESSLQSSADSAKSISDFTGYIVFGGILMIFGILMVWGISIELIWSLINTLQIITFLPLMIEYYPDHVKIMFEILEFVNMDIEYLSGIFTRITSINGLNTASYDARFVENGIDSPLFLSNWASLITSLLFTFLALLTFAILYYVLCCQSVKQKVGKILSAYFFNNFLRFLTEGYLEITFASILNIAARPIDSTAEIVSLIISVVVAIPMIIFPFMCAALLYDK